LLERRKNEGHSFGSKKSILAPAIEDSSCTGDGGDGG
jgi:hypothetical protein